MLLLDIRILHEDTLFPQLLSIDLIPANSSVWQALKRPTRALISQDSRHGWILNGEDMDFNYLPCLVRFDFDNKTFTNLSSAESWPLLETAFSRYVPTWGSAGLLMALGGNSTGNLLADLATIPVYDIGNQRWYKQLPQERHH